MQKYTKEEDAIILKYVNVFNGVKLACKELRGRSVSSVRARRLMLTSPEQKERQVVYRRLPSTKAMQRDSGRARRLRCVVVATKKRIKWTPLEDELIMTSKLSVEKIAKSLGRTYSSVCYRREVLRKRIRNAA